MTSSYDTQSFQTYGLRLQTEARRSTRSAARPAGRSLAPRLRALVARRSA